MKTGVDFYVCDVTATGFTWDGARGQIECDDVGHLVRSSVQWVKYVTLDEFHFDAGIALPTHLKIDVDGFERKVFNGGKRVIESEVLRSCAIEVNDDNVPFVLDFMTSRGFRKADELVHHDTSTAYTADYFFERP
jgi:hypothetical protein